MANPVITDCPKDVWTKVATNQTTGMIHILNEQPSAYLQTYRDTGLGGPVAPADDGEGVKFTGSLAISASAGIDVYILCRGIDGSVRVDL